MNRSLLLLLFLLLVWASPAEAQPARTTDVMLRTDGSEVPGRVLTITPLELRYLPPAGADTLRLATAEVFLVRYANGTRELLHSLPPSQPEHPDPLAGLDDAQRRALARQDAAWGYTDRTPFWGSLLTTAYGSPLLGWLVPACTGPRPVPAHKLQAPYPERLVDPTYRAAYHQAAQGRKRSQAWGGFGVGASVWMVLIGAMVTGAQ